MLMRRGARTGCFEVDEGDVGDDGTSPSARLLGAAICHVPVSVGGRVTRDADEHPLEIGEGPVLDRGNVCRVDGAERVEAQVDDLAVGRREGQSGLRQGGIEAREAGGDRGCAPGEETEERYDVDPHIFTCLRPRAKNSASSPQPEISHLSLWVQEWYAMYPD
jgi:hypothetical protein